MNWISRLFGRKSECSRTIGATATQAPRTTKSGKIIRMGRQEVAAFVKERMAVIPRDIAIPFEQYWKIFHNGEQLNVSTRDQLPEEVRDGTPETLVDLVKARDFQWAEGARNGIRVLTVGEGFRILQVNTGPFRSDIYRVSEEGYIVQSGTNDRSRPLEF